MEGLDEGALEQSPQDLCSGRGCEGAWGSSQGALRED